MTKSQTSWTNRKNSDPMNDQEKEAYQHMQDVIFNPAGKSSYIPRKIVEEEADTTDFTTPQGRKARSKRNLDFIKEQNSDCSPSLIQELAGKINNMQITLCHKSVDYNPIVQSKNLLSYRALKKNGIQFGGSTETGIASDEENFGNTGFVFTRPTFSGPADIIAGGAKVYVPIQDDVIRDHAWLSFNDWINYTGVTSDGRDDYAGNLVSDDRAKSYIYDFFQGKNDISQAAAYKAFEGIKTAMLIYQDDNKRYGFDEKKVDTYVRRGLVSERYRKCQMKEDNILTKPLSEYTLSEKQLAFLNDEHHPDREKLVADALQSTLAAMSQIAEVKVPHSLPLDKGACIYENPPFSGDVKLARFTSNSTQTHPLKFERSYDEHVVIVPKTHYPQARDNDLI